MSEHADTVLTIGHSTHSIEAFEALLRQHGVSGVADIRSVPFSRYNPQFNEAAVESSLQSCGIRYEFLGRELGARPDDPSCYEDGRVQYARLARQELFLHGLDRVIQLAHEYRVALMCAEKEPLDCHRTLLVAPELIERGLSVAHILADGRVEPHQATMARLLDAVGTAQADLFRSQSELLKEALARQQERVAYLDVRMKADEVRGF